MRESLFEPISKYEPRAGDWDFKKELRVQRLEDKVVPYLVPYMDDLGNDGRNFVQGVINQLRADSTIDAESFFGNYTLPLYVLYRNGGLYYTIDTEIEQVGPYGIRYLIDTPMHRLALAPEDKHRRAKSETFEHNPQTIKAADIVLAGLTPGLGINIDDQPEAVLKRAKELQGSDIVHITSNGEWIRFATILPGICIRYVSRKPGFLEDVWTGGPSGVDRRLDLEIWRPDQYQSYHPKLNH